MWKTKRSATAIGGFGIGLIMWVLEMAEVTIPLFWLIVLGLVALVMVIYGIIPYVIVAFHFVSGLRVINVDKQTVNKVENQPSKLAIVTNAIIEAEKITPKDKDIAVYITEANGLKSMYPQEIKDILLKLQGEERLTLKTFPDWLLTDTPLSHEKFDQSIMATLHPSLNHFTVTLTRKSGANNIH